MIRRRKSGKWRRLLRVEWEVVAGIVAAMIAIVLHFLHVVHVDAMFTIVLVLLALLLIRDLRREYQDDDLNVAVAQIKSDVQKMQLGLDPAAAILVGPRHLRSESQRFVETARGEMVWFNICFLMFRSQEVFDLLLRPAIENPQVRSIQFVADEGQQGLWEQNLLPKIEMCSGNEKVLEPRWRKLPQTVSFILAEIEPKGQTEALLSFWCEPFMARTTDRQVPRYIFRVQGHADLVSQLVEVNRQHLMDGDHSAGEA